MTMKNITHKITTLTPDIAAQWLATIKVQRALRPAAVKKYAAEMKQGLWQFNAETIIFNEDGELIQGQHRCHAVIAASVSIDVLVVRGMPRKVFATLDQGVIRHGGCVLSILGVPNSRLVATILNVIQRIANGGQSTRTAVSNSLIEKLWSEYPDAANASALIIGNRFLRTHFPSGWVGALWILGCRKHGQEVTDQFFQQLITGVNLMPGSPILLLRERAIAWTGAKGLLRESDKAAMMIKAWNAYIEKRQLKLLKYTRSGIAPEVFPTIL
jgi:hypothetical protein